MENKRKCVYVHNSGCFVLEIRDIYIDSNGNKRLLGLFREKNVWHDVPLEDCYFPYRNFFSEFLRFIMEDESNKR